MYNANEELIQEITRLREEEEVQRTKRNQNVIRSLSGKRFLDIRSIYLDLPRKPASGFTSSQYDKIETKISNIFIKHGMLSIEPGRLDYYLGVLTTTHSAIFEIQFHGYEHLKIGIQNKLKYERERLAAIKKREVAAIRNLTQASIEQSSHPVEQSSHQIEQSSHPIVQASHPIVQASHPIVQASVNQSPPNDQETIEESSPPNDQETVEESSPPNDQETVEESLCPNDETPVNQSQLNGQEETVEESLPANNRQFVEQSRSISSTNQTNLQNLSTSPDDSLNLNNQVNVDQPLISLNNVTIESQIDSLISNQEVRGKKRTRGRPAGSKNKKKL